MMIQRLTKLLNRVSAMCSHYILLLSIEVFFSVCVLCVVCCCLFGSKKNRIHPMWTHEQHIEQGGVLCQ